MMDRYVGKKKSQNQSFPSSYFEPGTWFMIVITLRVSSLRLFYRLVKSVDESTKWHVIFNTRTEGDSWWKSVKSKLKFRMCLRMRLWRNLPDWIVSWCIDFIRVFVEVEFCIMMNIFRKYPRDWMNMTFFGDMATRYELLWRSYRVFWRYSSISPWCDFDCIKFLPKPQDVFKFIRKLFFTLKLN